MRRFRHGFGLIELLEVIPITAMLLPAIGVVRSQAKRSDCANRRARIGLGLAACLPDNRGFAAATCRISWEDKPSSRCLLRAEDNAAKRAVYGEGIFVGYRGYDRNGIEPQFCFDHGLSYTTFAYADLAVSPSTIAGEHTVTATFTVTNTGKRAGAETARFHVSEPGCSVPRPPRELKGFERVELKPGESRTVAITLDRSAFAFFHPGTRKWTVEPGRCDVLVGRSSRELPLTASIAYRNP